MKFPLEILVKTNKNKTEIVKIENNVYFLNVKGKAIDNEANLEIIKFFSKLNKKRVRIVKGLKNRKKILDHG
jgi:uncharacterized protein (TIGR00251 family)